VEFDPYQTLPYFQVAFNKTKIVIEKTDRLEELKYFFFGKRLALFINKKNYI
jgi:hypothetical protein